MRLTFCAVCGSTESLEHHHFEPLGLGGPDIDTNLLTLCSAGGEVNRARHATRREALRPWLDADLSHAAVAENMNAHGMHTSKGTAWTRCSVAAARRALRKE